MLSGTRSNKIYLSELCVLAIHWRRKGKGLRSVVQLTAQHSEKFLGLGSRKFFDVKLAFATEVNNPLSGKKSPISDYASRDRALHKFRIANRVRLRAAESRYDFRRREFLCNRSGRERHSFGTGLATGHVEGFLSNCKIAKI